MEKMKRILALLLVMAMVMSLAACGKPAAQNAAQPEATQPEAAQAEKPVSVSVEKEVPDDLTALDREDKELIAELIGGQDGTELTDQELDTLIDRLVNQGSEETASGVVNLGDEQKAENPAIDTSDKSDAYDEDGGMNTPFDEVYPELIEEEKVSFSGESILIKLESDTLTEGLKAAGIGALEKIVPMGDVAWYEAKLTEGTDAKEALAAVRELDEVLLAEYNYEIQVAALDDYKHFDKEKEEEFQKNGHNKDQWHFHYCGIVDGYDQMQTNGGDPSVVVAVIDSGVDYDHEDLKDNMWVNTGEIPDNGIDDDGNGYIDDYYGVDIVAGRGSGDDTNGHGTHVAGIIAARNNNTGVLGIAYNVKIMSVKAAAHNGTLNQADIAKAVLYAYENGAEVINMSFGGTACSIAVQDALATAYTRCVLVASAGNNGAYNEGLFAIPNYPAALTYVLGVMSVDETGRESAFTNYDVFKYNGVEYELYAPGENIMSTLPNNQYGYLSGTSMAAPVVSAFAAILRSEFADRDKYPTKFIYGQLASTSGNYADCCNPSAHGQHNLPQITNLYKALTVLPKPELNVQDYALFDDPALSDKNNGDGVIDAGETIALGLTLRNRWGMSENTQVTIDTLSMVGLEDPYITIQNPTVDYGSVGTYSTQDCGRIIENDELVGWENPFLITVSEDCPNDYRITFNVTITCENALDEADTATYTFTGKVNEAVRSGCVLPAIIDEDMVLTSDSLYIIPRPTVIKQGVTVTVEPGTHIQFWSDDPNDPYAEEGIAYLRVEGNFFVEGTKENPVYIYPSELMSKFIVDFGGANDGCVRLRYADITNLNKDRTYETSKTYGISHAYGCTFRQNYGTYMYYRVMFGGAVKTGEVWGIDLGTIALAEKCVFYKVGSSYNTAHLSGTADTCIFVDSAVRFDDTYRNCVFLGNAFNDQTEPNQYKNSSLTVTQPPSAIPNQVYYDRLTGTTYVQSTGNGEIMLAYFRKLGGDYAIFQTREKFERVLSLIDNAGTEKPEYNLGITYDWDQEKYVFADGSALPDYLLRDGVTDGYHGNTLSLNFNRELRPGGAYYTLFEIPGKILPESITFRKYQLELDTETTLQLTPQNTPVQLPLDGFLYESSDEGVVTVSETGLVTPVGLGTADVWVYSLDRAVKNYVTITVKDYVALESIAFPTETAEVAIGEMLALECRLTPTDTTRTNLTYTSSNPAVAKVDDAGNVTGVGSGETVITAISAETDANGEPITASMTVTVYNKATSLGLGSAVISATLADGTVELPQVICSDGAEMALTWRSTDETVVAIEEGVLALKGLGTTSLIATDSRSGLSASCLVVIAENATSPVKDLQTNDDYRVALLEDGSLYLWDDIYHKEPTRFAQNVSLFALDGERCFAVMEDGSINSYYLRRPSIIPSDLSTAFVGREIVDIEGTSSSTFVLTKDGNAYAWGSDNSYGQLGVGVAGDVSEPTLINLDGIVDIEQYSPRTYFLTDQGELYCAGQVTNSTASAEPVLVDTGVAKMLYVDYNYCYYRSTDGTLKQYYYYNGIVSTVNWNTRDLNQVSFASNYGIGIKDGKAYTFYENGQPVEVPQITGAAKVFNCSGTYYIVTETGILYGFGYHSATDNFIPGNGTSSAETPVPIFLEPVAEESVSVTETNLDGENLRDGTLRLTFNKMLSSAAAKLYKDGNQITVQSTVEDYNYITVSRSAGFEEGVAYTLTFPAGSLTAPGGVTNTEEISITFTYTPDADATEGPVVPEEPVIHESQLDESIHRIMTTESLMEDFEAWQKETQHNSCFTGNAILNPLTTDTDVSHWFRPQGADASTYTEIPLGGNWWGTTNENMIDRQIVDYADMPTYARLMYKPYLTEAPENTFPFVTSVKLFNKNGEEVTTVGNETVTFQVSFNRDMDTSIPLLVRFGSAYPYGDYEIEGQYVDTRTWEGTYTLNTIIENGYQYFTISEGCSATDDLDLQIDRHRFMFEIDTTAAQALIMQGTATDTGVQLKWTQDDFVTLMGYNVYRATSEDGLYTRLNKTVIPADTMEWFDDTVEPGVVYYYNFTVVQTDMAESQPSGKIAIMSKDTMAPNIYHSPVSSAFTGSNLVLSATITDNLNIAFANLYYRIAGTESWNTVRMNKLNDKYSAIIPASSVTTAGIEYYIEAFDGVSYTYKGSTEAPYTVAVQEAVDANALGDVDGDGVITNRDALLVLYTINDKYNMTQEEFARADLNGDGVLWAAEALRILQYVSGVVGSVKM